MKKIISVLSALCVILACFPLICSASDIPTDEEIKDIYKKMGISTWGSGYFGCSLTNPEGENAPEDVIHQYIQSAGLLKDYTAQWEKVTQWDTYMANGYSLPYTKYIEIIDSVFVNHSDMKSFLNNEWNQMYDEATGIVRWETGGFGGPTDWIVQNIYKRSDSLIYVTGVMVEYGYDDDYFVGKTENVDYIVLSNYGESIKAEITEPIILTLQKVDGKWKILEYRENAYYIVDDVLYDSLENTQMNLITVENGKSKVSQPDDSKAFTMSFYGNGSKWYNEGDELSFTVTPEAGYKVTGVVLKDENGTKKIDIKDGVCTVAPVGTAVLTVSTESTASDVEISDDAEDKTIKLSEDKTRMYVICNSSVSAVADAITEDVEILNADGTKAEKSDLIASGMQLVIKDEKGETVDIKTVVVPGDVDGDAQISAGDARLALRASVELEELNLWASGAADADGGNEINASDARSILRASVELEDSSCWLADLV